MYTNSKLDQVVFLSEEIDKLRAQNERLEKVLRKIEISGCPFKCCFVAHEALAENGDKE